MDFRDIEPAASLYLPLLQMPLMTVKAEFLLWQSLCQKHSEIVIWKRAYELCQKDVFPAIKKLRTTMTQSRLNGLCLMYMHNDISVNTDVIVQKFAGTSRKLLL